MARELATLKGEDDQSDGKSLLNRRSYLRASAAAVAAAVGGTSVASAKRTVNAVDDLGMDASGSTPINDALRSGAADDTRIVFPAGTYRIDPLTLGGYDGLELVAPNGATLLPPSGNSTYLRLLDVRNLLVEGFTVDATASNTNFGIGLHAKGGENVIRDYAIEGTLDRAGGFLANWVKCEGGDTKVTYENMDLSDGASDDVIGLYAHAANNFDDPTRDGGTITLRDCHVEAFGHEGVYASDHRGSVRIVGGLYKNNCIQQIRVGGGNGDDESLVRDARIVVQDPPEYAGSDSYDAGHYRNYRGLWCEEGDRVLIENVDILVDDVDLPRGRSSGGLLIGGQFGRATVRNSRIEVNMDGYPSAIRADAPVPYEDSASQQSLDHAPPDYTVDIQNVSITGSAPKGQAILAEDREVNVDGCCVQETGVNCIGAYYRNGASGSITNTTLNTAGRAIRTSDSNVSTTGVRKDGTCPAPNLSARTSGSTGSSVGSSDSSTSTTPNQPLLEIGSVEDGPLFSYEFTTTEEPSFATDVGDNSADPQSNDVIAENDDGTYTVTGATGGGYGDAYYVPGEITAFSTDTDPANHVLTLDGSEVTVDELLGDASDRSGSRESSDSEESLFEIVSVEEETVFDYQFTTTEEPAFATDVGDNSADPMKNDEIRANGDGTYTVVSTTGRGYGDAYYVSGEITAFSTDADPTNRVLKMDGSEVTVGELLGDSSEPVEPRTLEIVSVEGGPLFSYEFTTPTEPSLVTDAGDNSADPQSNDAITENDDGTYTVTGATGGGYGDAYEVAAVDSFSTDTDAANYVLLADGTEITADELVEGRDPLPRTLSIVGDGSPTNYAVTIDGQVEKRSADSATVSSPEAEGVVVDETDSYAFSGQITDYEQFGDATVKVDGSTVDPASLGDAGLPNTLVVDGRDSSGSTSYEIAVSGEMQEYAGALESADEVSAGTVVGSVESGRDAIQFTGSVETLRLDGNAELEFDTSSA